MATGTGIACQALVLAFQYFVVLNDLLLLWKCYDGFSLLLLCLFVSFTGTQLSYWLVRWTGPGYVLDFWDKLMDNSCMTDVKCTKCNKFKSRHSHHCSQCGKCVLLMDHHCIWMGVCIGYLNVGNYVRFLAYAYLTCGLHCLATVQLCRNDGDGYVLGKRDVVFMGVNFVLCGIVGLLVGVLLVKSVFNFMNGETTIDSIKRNSLERRKPAVRRNDKEELENLKLFMGKNIFLWPFPQLKTRSLDDYVYVNDSVELLNDENDEEDEYLIAN